MFGPRPRRRMPENGLKWKRAKGLEPSTYGLGSPADHRDARQRSNTIASSHAGLRPLARSLPACLAIASRDVCGTIAARPHPRHYPDPLSAGRPIGTPSVQPLVNVMVAT